MNPRIKRFLQSWVINTLAVLVAVHIVPGIRFRDSSVTTVLVTTLVLGILNAFIRPILELMALPLLILTLGLFRLVINAVLLYCVGVLLWRYFQVDSFWAAFLGALVISIISLTLNILTGNSKVKIERHRGGGSNPPGNGPVIDV